ncbi:MerR family transcriptional regulator [Acinetobacter rudis]|uniref:MerR family transcriptional regulator n=1 Tax=Acinetobacter rudis TaxID=632955 RepID=A0AAW8J489_9GAMM|nr:MerR family transcriptional regulator [Acinetobacter rudis]MDQ8934414.1 MerR family transcriptional regulator [Acinetobacter rudis]MDQ8951891.1 MerR family transcriptional regulator [Acinetobacter rudis]MDQ9016686.1 MerR family transcriptional regulator [Acinetobacter rudis]
MKEIDIGDLAKQTKLSTATIRFYETKGLIKSIGRNGLRRQYPIEVKQTLALVKLLKSGGVSLKEIEDIFLMKNTIKVNRETLDGKITEMKDKVIKLNTLIKTLEHIQHCPHEDHLSCPEFIKLLASHQA